MTRAADIAVATVMWCIAGAYLVVGGGYGSERRGWITVREVRIEIAADTTAAKTVGTAMVAGWLSEAGFSPLGEPIDAVDTRAMEAAVGTRPEVRHVSAWTDLRGTLTVKVTPRVPIMRVRSSAGAGAAAGVTGASTTGAASHRFWYTDDGYIIPDRGDFSVRIPIVTGNIPFPFGASQSGSYAGIVRADYEDFLGQFALIESERTSLVARRATIRADIRANRARGPRRWWSDSRKEAFNSERTKRLDALREQEAHQNAALAALEAKKRSLAEKEKKSYQSHRFLPKLANFVKFIESDDFWAAQIVQINVTGGDDPGKSVWREPQIELIPRAGDHVVLLGELDGEEAERLRKLRRFYLDGLWYEGWDHYSLIDIRYRNQVVCRK